MSYIERIKNSYIPYAAAIVFAFALAIFVSYGASTISTNISTDGTLSVTGLSSLLGQASTTRLSAFDRIYVGGTATSTILGDSATSTFSGGLTLAAGNVNVPTGGVFLINNARVLDATTLGSAVVGSSLTSVGTLTSLTVSGNVGIGTTTPNWKLQVAATRPFFTLSDTAAGTNLEHWTLSSQGGNLYFASSSDAYATSTTPRLTILSSGLVGVNTASPSYNLDVSGTFNVSGAATHASTLGVTGLTTLGNATTTQLTVAGRTYLGAADADTLTVRAGVWSLTSTATTTIALTNGVNINSNTFVIDPNANSIGIGTTTGANFIKRHGSNTASLDYGVIPANGCQGLTISVVGAADGDTVVLGVPNALASASSTFTFYGFVSAANTVTARLCQVATQASSDPAPATIRADVWGH